jgi:hypothetical protein
MTEREVGAMDPAGTRGAQKMTSAVDCYCYLSTTVIAATAFGMTDLLTGGIFYTQRPRASISRPRRSACSASSLDKRIRMAWAS